MNKISLKKNIELYFFWRRILKDSKENLEKNYSTKIDKVFRLYSVINIPIEGIDEPYRLRTRDIEIFSEKYIREYTQKISGFLNSVGLSELYDLYEIKKVDKFSFLVIIGYKFFNTEKVARNFWFKILPIFIVLITSLIILLTFL